MTFEIHTFIIQHPIGQIMPIPTGPNLTFVVEEYEVILEGRALWSSVDRALGSGDRVKL